MEIKAKLDKPISEEKRCNFIIEQNYNNGYEIRENSKTIEAWGYTKEEKEQQQKEHIADLTCTKRVFILMLEELGLDYFEQIEPLINANRQAKLEWTLCETLLRSNPLIDILASQLSITSEQLDKLFLYANGEITLEQFKK